MAFTNPLIWGLHGRTLPSFNYVDHGSLAVIGQNHAVVDLGFIKLKGFLAWLFWLLVHIYYLIEFDNKLVVMTQWIWNYFSGNRGARLITQDEILQNLRSRGMSEGSSQPAKTPQQSIVVEKEVGVSQC